MISEEVAMELWEGKWLWNRSINDVIDTFFITVPRLNLNHRH